MALKLTITDSRGVTATYHQLAMAVIDYSADSPVVTARVRSYVNQAARDAENLPFGGTAVWSRDVVLTSMPGAINQSTIYAALKKSADFLNATDC